MKARPAAGSLLDSYHLLTYDAVDSTNDEARRLAQGGASHGAVIWAQEQLAGKGRRGRPWVSQPGNLFVSFLLQPPVELAKAPQLSFLTAVAIAEALEPIVDEPGALRLKWPNDVLFREEKLGGILIETEPSENPNKPWIIVGCGINVESYPSGKKMLFPATCLKEAGVEIISAKIVLSRVLSHFMERYDEWVRDGFTPVRGAWLEHAWRLGEEVAFDSEEKQAHGIFRGINESGCLELETDEGIQVFSAGDVTLRKE